MPAEQPILRGPRCQRRPARPDSISPDASRSGYCKRPLPLVDPRPIEVGAVPAGSDITLGPGSGGDIKTGPVPPGVKINLGVVSGWSGAAGGENQPGCGLRGKINPGVVSGGSPGEREDSWTAFSGSERLPSDAVPEPFAPEPRLGFAPATCPRRVALSQTSSRRRNKWSLEQLSPGHPLGCRARGLRRWGLLASFQRESGERRLWWHRHRLGRHLQHRRNARVRGDHSVAQGPPGQAARRKPLGRRARRGAAPPEAPEPPGPCRRAGEALAVLGQRGRRRQRRYGGWRARGGWPERRGRPRRRGPGTAGSGAGGNPSPGTCQKGQTKAAEVVIMGESFLLCDRPSTTGFRTTRGKLVLSARTTNTATWP